MSRHRSGRRKPVNRAQRDLDRPPRERYATRYLTVESDGAICRGTLYLPSGEDDPPVVVLAGDIGTERTTGLPAFAERLADAGVAAFTFDYRGFGDSDGDDALIAPARQRTDLEAAVDRVARVDAVGHRIVVAGFGLGGGHALAVASDRTDLDAAMAVAPVLDGRAFLRRRGTKPFLRALLAGIRDATIGRIAGGREVPIVGTADELAAVAGPGAERAYLDLVDRESHWQNRTPARSLVGLARFDVTETLEGVRVPTLVIGGNDDAQVPVEGLSDAADSVPDSTFVRMPADHWSMYGRDFEPFVGHVRAFLQDALE